MTVVDRPIRSHPRIRQPRPPTTVERGVWATGGAGYGRIMTIEVRRLQDWIGAEVLDSAGEKLGKLEDVFFRGEDARVVSIRSGLAGRKHHAASLRDAAVDRGSLHLGATGDTIVALGSTGIGAEVLHTLAALDDELLDVRPGELESWTARSDRLSARAQAEADADKLEAQAQHHAQAEDAAIARAHEAEQEAEAARLARHDADAQAQRARQDAR